MQIVSFCARCPLRRASGQYTYRSVPQISCAELVRYTASGSVCESTGAWRVAQTSIQSAQNRSKLFPRTARNPTRCIPAALRKCPVGAINSERKSVKNKSGRFRNHTKVAIALYGARRLVLCAEFIFRFIAVTGDVQLNSETFTTKCD